MTPVVDVQEDALAWAHRKGLECFDLGGAHDCPDGYVAVDHCVRRDGDEWIESDVLEWLAALPSDCVGVIRAVDFLEHVADQIRLMNEIHRVLVLGGMLLSSTPSTDGRGAFCDPTHVSFWNELSFRYYCDETYAKYVPSITARFCPSRLFTHWPTPWHKEQNLPYVVADLVKEAAA